MTSISSSQNQNVRSGNSWRHVMRGIWMALGLLVLTAGPAWAQNPAFLQGPNFGTFSLGEVAIPLAASGGGSPGNYTWDIIGGALPPGVSLRTDSESWPSWFPPNTSAALLGVATTANINPYAFTLRVTSGATSSVQNAQVRITALTVTESWTLPRAYVGKPFSYQLKVENASGPVTWAQGSGTLLASFGLFLNPNTGIISGTPSRSGFFNIRVDPTDVSTTFRWINIEIFDIEITTPGALPNAIQGQPYLATLSASGGTAPYTWSLGGLVLPAGLVLDPTAGTITGVTTNGRTVSNFSLTVTDANGVSSFKRMSLAAIRAPQGPPRIQPYSNRWDDCTIGVPCDRGVSAFSGGTLPFTFAISGQPRGLFVSSTDSWTPADVMITGTPVELGDFNVTVTVTDAVGLSTTNVFPLRVSPLWLRFDSFKPTDLINGVIDTPYFRKLSILGGVLPHSASILPPSASNTSSLLPPGLTLDSTLLTVDGTPTAANSFFPVFEYTDSAGARLRVTDGLFIDGSFASGGGFGTIDINTFFDLGTATLNSFFTRTLSACCAPSFLWTAIEPPPPGLTLGVDGTLSGTPTTAGVFTFKIRAADGMFPNANWAEQRFTLRVAAPVASPILFQGSSALPFGNVGAFYTTQVLATSTAGTITWSLQGGQYLPPGILLASDGTLSGTPGATGQFSFNLVATDPAGTTATRFFTLFVFELGEAPPLDLPIGPNLGTFAVGAQTINLAATGGVGPYHYSLTPGAPSIPGMRVQDGQPLPTSVNFTGSTITGVFLGVLTQPGTYTSSIRVVDAAGTILDRPITLIVHPMQILSQNPLPRASVGTPYSFTFTPFGYAGFTGPYTWSATSMPPGMTMTVGATLQGTPTGAGNFSVRVVLKDIPTAQEFVSFFTLNVDPFAILTNGDLPLGRVGTPYNQPLSAPGCVNCTWVLNGSLPAGLALNNGVISGTPTGTTTNFTFTIQAVGTNGTAQRLFRIQIAAAAAQPLSIVTGGSFGDRTVSGLFTISLIAQGGTAPYTWSLDSGALPTGTELALGEQLGANIAPGVTHIAGRPMEVGLFVFTLRVTDALGASVTRTFTQNVSALNWGYFSLPVTGPVFSNPLVLDSPYDQPLLGIGGDGVYTWTNTGPMPDGLTLADGAVSGTPKNTGSFSVPVTLADNSGNTFSTTLGINIASPTGISINFGQAANIGTVQKALNFSRNLNLSGGSPPYTVVAETPLPPGLELADGAELLQGAAAGSWFLIGTPMGEGTFTFRLRATDSAGNVGARTFTMTMAPFWMATPTALADASVGVPYSQNLLAVAENGSVLWTLSGGSMPPGFNNVTSGGSITGTPTTAGTFSFVLTATHSSGIALNFTFTIRISNLQITSPAILPFAEADVPYSHTFTATGGGPTLVWSAIGLPGGLGMGPDGVISGTTTGFGGFSNILVTVTDGVSTVSRRFALFQSAPNPQVLSYPATLAALTDATVGQSYTSTLNPIGGVPPYTAAVAPGSALPPGLQLVSGALLPPNFAPGTTLILGAPTTAGTYSFDLIITDSVNAQLRRTFTLRVSSISIVAGGIRTGVVGTPYAQQFTTVGGTSPYTYSMVQSSFVQDMLPPGVTFSPAGLISGTPTATGLFSFRLTAQDAVGNTFTRAYSWTVTNGVGQFVSINNLPDTSIGSGRQQSLNAFSPAPTTFTWSVVGGALPPGMSLNSGPPFLDDDETVLSGRPAAVGNYTYTLRATDNANPANFADRVFALRVLPMQIVSPPVELFDTNLPTANVGVPYSTTIKASGGTAPYTFSLAPGAATPPGLTLSPAGVLSGTPTEAGCFGILVAISDANNETHRGISLATCVTAPGVAPPLMSAIQGEVLLNGGSVGMPYLSGALDAWIRFGQPPYSWSVNPASMLPPGIVLLPGGNGVSDRLSGVPTVAGEDDVLLDVTDASGQTLTVRFELFVSSLVLTPATVSPGVVGVPYSVQFVPSGGTAPYAVQLLPVTPVSDLPPGLTLSSGGLLSGTPTHAGNFTVGFVVADAVGNFGFRQMRLTIDNAAGEAPAATMTPRAIQVLHVQGVSTTPPVPVGVTTTSGAFPFNAFFGGIPGATLAPLNGATPGALTLDLAAALQAPGTYTGSIGLVVPGAANLFDEIPVTLTVLAPPPCTFTLTPSGGTIGAGGGFNSFQVATQAHCVWTATTPDPAMLTVPSAPRTGSGSLSYTVTRNLGTTPRVGTIDVMGETFTVTQFGGVSCSFALLPASETAPQSGANFVVKLVASAPTCAWTASSLDLALAPASGTGTTNVAVTVPPNLQAATRIVTATIGGQTFSVDQAGFGCTVSLSPYDTTIPAGGGNGSVGVLTPPGCGYATSVGPNWISVTSGGSGVGDGTLLYTVAPNSTTLPRSGSMNIGGQTFQVNQDALACSVTLTPSLTNPFGATGGAGSIGITTNGANCAWNASSDSPWALVTPPSGTGNGTVFTTIGSNANSTTARSAGITINGQLVSLNQAGTACTYALQSDNGSVPATGGSGSVGVIAAAVCGWTSVSNAPTWLSITSSGTAGTADVTFVAQANPSATPRVGTLTVAGRTYTVNQGGAACSFTTAPTLVNISETGAANASFNFSTGAVGCTAPTALSYVNWITVNNTSFAGSAGSVTFDVALNPSDTTRTGSIQVGDATFTVRQTGGTCGYSLASYGALFDKNGGDGNVFGSPTALGCTPTNGTTQPGFITLHPLIGPVSNVFTQAYTVAPFNVQNRVVRSGHVTFGGVLFTVKQKSY